MKSNFRKSVCVLDYGSGNVKSVLNILLFLGYDAKISNSSFDIKNSSHIILPGVGSYGSAMEKIKKSIPIDVLENEVINKCKPFLGICVGMQVLSTIGLEFGEHNGLGWIPGKVKIHNTKNEPSIHIGWNNTINKQESLLTKNIDEDDDFYFVHSYSFDIDNKDNIVSETSYGSNFPSIISKKNIYGVQFHPEKSQNSGFKILKNFLEKE